MSTWFNLYYFQDPNSPYAENMIYFHNLTMLVLIVIVSIVIYILIDLMMMNFTNKNLLNNHLLEIVWTIVPMFLLLFIAVPSIKLLYLIDEIWSAPYFTVKVVGHQWYWSYEYNDLNGYKFDSFMIMEFSSIEIFRNLDVDNRMVVPFKVPMRILVTSEDVIHSWTVPSLAIKLDATPGRINQVLLMTLRPGLFYGQCSEICGINHSFMPISLESTSYIIFINWLNLNCLD